MPRTTRVLPAAARDGGRIVDTLILSFAQRQVQRGFLFGINGACIELDFAEPARLRMDDALLLDDGGLVEVVAEAEPLFEVRVAEPAALARLAWHLGGRHVPVEVKPNRLRVCRTSEVAALLQALGAKFVEIEAPFEPEDSAGPAAGADHPHDHDHHHHHHDHKQS
jgi:urease accessory protein